MSRVLADPNADPRPADPGPDLLRADPRPADPRSGVDAFRVGYWQLGVRNSTFFDLALPVRDVGRVRATWRCQSATTGGERRPGAATPPRSRDDEDNPRRRLVLGVDRSKYLLLALRDHALNR